MNNDESTLDLGLLDMPNEIIFRIFDFVKLGDIGALAMVSTRFRDIAQQMIGKKCSNLSIRLDLYYPPDELPEGVLILEYNKKKRNRVSDHIHKKFRKIKLIKRGVPDSILQRYPTCNLSDLNLTPFNIRSRYFGDDVFQLRDFRTSIDAFGLALPVKDSINSREGELDVKSKIEDIVIDMTW